MKNLTNTAATATKKALGITTTTAQVMIEDIAILGIIRRTLNRYYMYQRAIDGETSFAAAEMRADSKETIVLRNKAAYEAARMIFALNREVNVKTGTPFLTRRYDINIRFGQENIKELENLIYDYEELLATMTDMGYSKAMN